MQTLVKVRELLSNPEHWTKHALAKDKNMGKVYPKDPNAVCWCLVGAIEHFSEDEDEINQVIYFLSDKIPPQYSTIADFNDSEEIKHSNVLHILDKALGNA